MQTLDMPIEFDWNGEVVRFANWRDDAFGSYDYTTRDRLLRVVYTLQSDGDHVNILLRDVEGWPPRLALPAVTLKGGRLFLASPSNAQPRTVPEALALVVMWAEGALRCAPGAR